jgi:hypothetical protein
MLELYSITIPNAKSAATQKTSMVTASFTRNSSKRE